MQSTSVLGLLASVPPTGKGLAGVLIGTYALQFIIPPFKQLLALSGGKAVTRPWQLVTSGFVEDGLPNLIVFVAGLLVLSRVVEPAYGSRGLLKFLLVAQAGAGVATFMLVTLLYYVSVAAGEATNWARLAGVLYTPICGFEGGFGALLVAAKHLIPDNEVALAGGLLKFRAKHLAAVYVLLMTVLGGLLGAFLEVAPFALFGTYFAWLYLRYFHVGQDGLRGDASEDFSFASFFPQPVQPVVDKLAAACAALTRLQHTGSSGGSSSLDQAARGYALGGAPLPGSGADDAARRRQRGAKALEERLGLKSAPSGGAAAAPGGPPPPAAAMPGGPSLAEGAEVVEAGGDA